MVYYIVTASIAWANYERPVLFENMPTNDFDVVGLNFSIDCRDCRRFLTRQPDGRLWTLSWDYTDLPGGCAGRSPSLFDDALKAHCAAQHNMTSAADEYYPIIFGQCPNGFDFVIPYVVTLPDGSQRYLPASQSPTIDGCQARCSATPGCVGFGYTPLGFSNRAFGVTFPAGSCFLASAQECTFFDPVDTATEGPVTFYYKKLPPPGPKPANPLDKCSITNLDVAMFAQSASLDPGAAKSVNEAYRDGFGWNPNYIGEEPVNPKYPDSHLTDSFEKYFELADGSPGFLFGQANPDRGKGSNYTLHSAVPLCYAGDGGGVGPDGVPRGMFLEFLSIPHHAFADPVQIGHAKVTITSTDGKFRQENMFQPYARARHDSRVHTPAHSHSPLAHTRTRPTGSWSRGSRRWHKNTMHLGLTVNQDHTGEVTSSEPFFSNFQYDGRVDWGKEESLTTGNVLDAQQMARLVFGDNYNGRMATGGLPHPDAHRACHTCHSCMI